MTNPRTDSEVAGTGPGREVAQPAVPSVGRTPWTALLVIAAVTTGSLLVAAGRYGYERDELYNWVAGQHLAFGYVDTPPLVPLLARGQDTLFGDGVAALRVAPAILAGVLVLLAALIARELGGRPVAQVAAALATLACPQVLIDGRLLHTTVADMTAETALVWLMMRAPRVGGRRSWLAAGIVAGIAFEAKDIVVLLLAAVAVGLLATGNYRVLRSRYTWYAVAVAAVIAAPTLIWQAAHGFPEFSLAQAIAGADPARSRERLIPAQTELIGWIALPLFVAGLAALLARPAWRRFRPLVVGYLVAVVALLVIAGKPYYDAAWWPLVLGAGCVWAVDVLPAWLARRGHGFRGWAVACSFTVIGLNLALSVAQTMPVVPVQDLNALLAHVGNQAVDSASMEQVGWPELVGQVNQAYQALSPAERSATAIVTMSAAEAAALDRFGPAYHLPSAYSGEAGFYVWGPPPARATSVIVVGIPAGAVIYQEFARCASDSFFTPPDDIENGQYGAAIVYCDQPSEPWSELWPSMRTRY